MVEKKERERVRVTHTHTQTDRKHRVWFPPPSCLPHSIFLLPHIRLCCCFSLLAFSCFYFTFLFLCACVGCVCVVSFGICFLLCLTFFTFSTRLLIEAFHSFLLRLRVYPHTHTHTCVRIVVVRICCCTYICIGMCVRSQDLHLAPFRCTTPRKMFSHFTVGTREKGSTLFIVSVCVCLRNFCLRILHIVLICLALFI